MMNTERKVDVLAVMDGAAGAALTRAGKISGDAWVHQAQHDALVATRAAVAELIEADKEYDAAIYDLSELNRRIAEQGWIEVEHDALRKAGERLVRARNRRADALARIGGAQ